MDYQFHLSISKIIGDQHAYFIISKFQMVKDESVCADTLSRSTLYIRKYNCIHLAEQWIEPISAQIYRSCPLQIV